MTIPLVADGYGLDRAWAALFWSARAGETVSVQAARERVAGRWPGCALCWLLGDVWTPWGRGIVEPDHCTKALASGDVPTAAPAAYRAGAALVVLTVAAWAVPWMALRAVRALR